MDEDTEVLVYFPLVKAFGWLKMNSISSSVASIKSISLTASATL